MKVVFAPGCVLRRKSQPAIDAVMAQLQRIYGEVELYDRCCRNKFPIEGEAKLISICSYCHKTHAAREGIESKRLWEDIAEHPEVPFENEPEVRELVRAAYRRPKPAKAVE